MDPLGALRFVVVQGSKTPKKKRSFLACFKLTRRSLAYVAEPNLNELLTCGLDRSSP